MLFPAIVVCLLSSHDIGSLARSITICAQSNGGVYGCSLDQQTGTRAQFAPPAC